MSLTNSRTSSAARTRRTLALEWLCIAAYLTAAVVANLSVAYFGPKALLVTAAVLIPFDLCVRDILHERWHHSRVGLWTRMALLILSGSIISAAINTSAWTVAVASFVAFAAAGFVDTIVYAILHKQHRFTKMNASNLCSSITDSIIFPVVAFGGTTLALAFSQATIKFVGGLIITAAFVVLLARRDRTC